MMLAGGSPPPMTPVVGLVLLAAVVVSLFVVCLALGRRFDPIRHVLGFTARVRASVARKVAANAEIEARNKARK